MGKTQLPPLQRLLDDVDWDVVMKAERSAGGHSEVMDALFKTSKIIGGFIQDEYQGYLGYAYRMKSGHVAIITDSFGSCSGCDSWEGANDEEARRMVTAMVTSAHIEPDIKSAQAYLAKFAGDDESKWSAPTDQWALRSIAADLAADIVARRMIVIPRDTPASTCKACGATMYFVGKNPVSADVEHGKAPNPNARDGLMHRENRAQAGELGDGRGISHFANCPNADQFRRGGAQ